MASSNCGNELALVNVQEEIELKGHIMNCSRGVFLIRQYLLLAMGLWFVPVYEVEAQSNVDTVAEIQRLAATAGQSDVLHWGPDASRYSSWKTHTNRLIPIYTFGLDLKEVSDAHNVYRSEDALRELYGTVPAETLNPEAKYFDQTDVFRLQKLAIARGKKRIVLLVFDGMDWQTTRAAAIVKTGKVSYDTGRGQGLAFQDYRGVETDFGYFVCSPHNDGTSVDVNEQRVINPGGKTPGGYDPKRAGHTPWETGSDPRYIMAEGAELRHAYTDSSSSASSLTCGIKTYNNAVNVDFAGREVVPLARKLQQEGWSVGVVTNVPISHATPAAAYANNVHRSDYQDLTRDMLGRPSIYHAKGLDGVDVLLGTGWGETKTADGAQGNNFVPGNRYLTAEDEKQIDLQHGGRYVIAQRTPGKVGAKVLDEAVRSAVKGKHRLFGFFGYVGTFAVGASHLPFRTSDGRYNPVMSVGNPDAARPEAYTAADLSENVTLAEMTLASLDVLQAKSDRWWLMIEAGDVDWANHVNNIDNSIGGVHSGDEAFSALVKWIEQHGGWQETCVIVTADHGHYLVLDDPSKLAQ